MCSTQVGRQLEKVKVVCDLAQQCLLELVLLKEGAPVLASAPQESTALASYKMDNSDKMPG